MRPGAFLHDQARGWPRRLGETSCEQRFCAATGPTLADAAVMERAGRSGTDLIRDTEDLSRAKHDLEMVEMKHAAVISAGYQAARAYEPLPPALGEKP